MSDVVLRLAGATVTHGASGARLLDAVHLTLHAGVATGLVGPSGAGKTLTGLSCQNLIEPPLLLDAASIEVLGQPVSTSDAARWSRIRGRVIAWVPQDPEATQNPVLSLGALLRELLWLHRRIRGSAARAECLRLLAEVGLDEPEKLLGAFTHELSMGMRQRVALALALAGEPRILIADEPTSALDPTHRAGILELLGRVRKTRDLAVLLIAHDLAAIEASCTELVTLREGRVCSSGPMRHRDLYGSSLVARPPTKKPRPPSALDERSDETALVELEGVSKRYHPKGPWCAHEVGLVIQKRQALGLVGESGAGKTTVSRMLVGALTPTRGRVRLFGQEVSTMTSAQKRGVRRRLQLIHQDVDASLNPRRRVLETLLEAIRVDPRERDAELEAKELLESVGLDISLGCRFAHELSGGQRQRVVIARALCAKPELIVADEPFSALDRDREQALSDLFNALRRDCETALVIVSHDIERCAQLCDHLAVMLRGRIIEYAPSREVLEHPSHPYTRELINSLALSPSPHGESD